MMLRKKTETGTTFKKKTRCLFRGHAREKKGGARPSPPKY
jgi:hypothetical protein